MTDKEKEFMAALRKAGLQDAQLVATTVNEFILAQTMREIQSLHEVVASMLQEMHKERPEKTVIELLAGLKDDMNTQLCFSLTREKVGRANYRRRKQAMMF